MGPSPAVATILDKLVDDIAPNKRCLVHELMGDFTWAGFGPSGGGKRGMFDWLDKNWDKSQTDLLSRRVLLGRHLRFCHSRGG
jgi:hypothetical protein